MDMFPFEKELFSLFSRHINEEKVALFPTETSYGFSCNAFSTKALASVEEIKHRTQKPFIILFPSFEEAKKFVFLPIAFNEYFFRSKNEPMSFLVQKNDAFPKTFFPGETLVAIRVPSNPLLREFLASHGVPIISTSANRSGKPPQFDPQEIVETFGRIDDLLFVNAGILPKRAPSMLFQEKNGEVFRLR